MTCITLKANKRRRRCRNSWASTLVWDLDCQHRDVSELSRTWSKDNEPQGRHHVQLIFLAFVCFVPYTSAHRATPDSGRVAQTEFAQGKRALSDGTSPRTQKRNQTENKSDGRHLPNRALGGLRCCTKRLTETQSTPAGKSFLCARTGWHQCPVFVEQMSCVVHHVRWDQVDLTLMVDIRRVENGHAECIAAAFNALRGGVALSQARATNTHTSWTDALPPTAPHSRRARTCPTMSRDACRALRLCPQGWLRTEQPRRPPPANQ